MSVSKLEKELERFNHITNRLRVLGLTCAFLSFINLIHTLWRIVIRSRYIEELAICSVTMLFTVLICIVLFDFLRKKGDVLFEEISDELQWGVYNDVERKSDKEDYPVLERSAEERPRLHVRIVLRSFSRAADLPLVPGRFGPAIYLLINIVLALITLASRLGGMI